MPLREQPLEPQDAPTGAAFDTPDTRDDREAERNPRRRMRREVDADLPLPPPTAIRGTYRRIGTTLALIGASLIGALMWYYGGVFSLDYLGDTFAPIAALVARTPWWQHWWIPVLISAVEIFLWPRRERRASIFILRLLLWLAVLAFDVLTTVRGVLPVLASVGLPALNQAGERQWLAYGISGAFGIAFAYLPEKIARWVLSDLWNLWVAPLWRRLRRSRTGEASV